ncbi:MAG: tRNA (guanosine(46)-N7)-methyltransferase TrmB [Planctomycetales bacterium]|nr:tRNA (guanosine(46)-N7)-methyltransferase TrmB [Planctomycetales bacterium]MCA9219821.1 tRNA (guanosine(46)-N7)-methyltransferase TrmB [Planctomycetales bacterium]
MGRRALSKIDPTLDVTPFLRKLDQLPTPFDPAEFFGRAAPLELEMGSGKGWFLTQSALRHPDRNFVGVEYAKKYAYFCASRLAKFGLTNALMIDGDGLRLFHEFYPARIADRVHVYFPDPWWKKRHRKRRVLNESFLQDAFRVLKPAGRLVFWTDVQEYFDTSLELIAATTQFSLPIPVEEPGPEEFRTHFERRKRMIGETIYRAEFEKPKSLGDEAT